MNLPQHSKKTTLLSLLILSIILSGCDLFTRQANPSPTRPWKSVVERENQTTRVTTIDGSVWKGEAQLIEEASIGLADGPEEYMLLQPNGVSVDHRRERIAISDYRVPIVRIYDFEGKHLFDVGRGGDGPGEYRRINGVYLNEDDGKIYVHRYMYHWINIYDSDGQFLESWEYDMRKGMGSMRFKQGADGVLQIGHVDQNLRTGESRESIVSFTLNGVAIDTLHRPEFPVSPPWISSEVGGTWLPFSPINTWDITAHGHLIWGYGDSFNFHISKKTGEQIVVEKYWERIPVLREEANWEKQSIAEWLGRGNPSWNWDGPSIPDFKPAFRLFHADLSDRIWVYSEGPSVRLPSMVDASDEELANAEFSSWKSLHQFNLFDLSGRYLGPVAFEDRGYTGFYIEYAWDDVVLVHVYDEEDVSYFKRYRLVIPQ